MQSAFGIEHDQEISKARFKLVRVPKHRVASGPPGPTGTQKIKDALGRAGDTPVTVKGVGRSAGRGLGRVSRAFESYPGLTGTALVGGGGAAGYKYLNNKEPKKKR